jgi:hypothetical protein
VKFEEQQESARQLARDVQGWLRHVKENFEAMHQLSLALEDLYTSWGGVTVKSLERVKAYKECSVSFITNVSRELVSADMMCLWLTCLPFHAVLLTVMFFKLQETLVRSIVYARIDIFLKLFNNPAQVIVKRSNKLIDYDRANGIKQKGGVPDKTLQESAEAYVSINAQLVDELPRFLTLSAQYFELIVEELTEIQAKFHKLMIKEWKRYLFKGSHAIAVDDKTLDTMAPDHIVAAYKQVMQDLEPSIEDIIAINPSQWENEPGFQATAGGADSNISTPTQHYDQYFGSFGGGMRNPSLHSLPLSDGECLNIRAIASCSLFTD